MPHLRERHCLPILMKKIKFSPVIAIQGARQTGKSVLISSILPKILPDIRVETFDSEVIRDFATSNPETFLAEFIDTKTLAIDEAQKVPKIFDAVKLRVDKNRRPGMYILLGSTEFSILTKIRESLTGRMTRLKVFPFTLAEVHQIPLNHSPSPIFVSEKPRLSRSHLVQFLNRGGLPGVFYVRSEEAREELLRDWLDLTLERDILLIPGLKLDTVLARKILNQIAVLPEPTAGNLAKCLKVNIRKIHTHIKALETLFVIHSLAPHSDGTGKPLYFLFDVALATLLGAPFERQLHTLVLQEILAQISYRGIRTKELYYYRGPKGGLTHLVVQEGTKISAVKILSEEKIDFRELMGLMAWRKKNPNVTLFALGAQRASLKKEKIEIYPWEAIG